MSEPNEENWRMQWDGFEKHADALGYLVVLWSIIEGEIDALIVEISGNSVDNFIIIGHIDMREKIDILKSLAFSRDVSWREDGRDHSIWYQRLIEQLKILNGTLRLERNRLIHDRWRPGTETEGATQTSLRPQISRPQSHQRPTMQVGTRRHTTAENIWNLNKRIAICMNELSLLCGELQSGVMSK